MWSAILLEKHRLDLSRQEIVKAPAPARDFRVRKDRNSFFVCVKRPQKGIEQYESRRMRTCCLRRTSYAFNRPRACRRWTARHAVPIRRGSTREFPSGTVSVDVAELTSEQHSHCRPPGRQTFYRSEAALRSPRSEHAGRTLDRPRRVRRPTWTPELAERRYAKQCT